MTDDEHLREGGPVSITDDAVIDATMQGAVLGTLPYMAPEQAAGRIDKIDARTDIYGLGAILFAILTGNHPHRGTSTREVRAHILNEPTPHVRADNATIHPGLDAICAKAMAKKHPSVTPKLTTWPRTYDVGSPTCRSIATASQ